MTVYFERICNPGTDAGLGIRYTQPTVSLYGAPLFLATGRRARVSITHEQVEQLQGFLADDMFRRYTEWDVRKSLEDNQYFSAEEIDEILLYMKTVKIWWRNDEQGENNA